MSKELKLRYSNYVSMLTLLIKNHTYICTTADIWSSNNKSYLGSTCHFIDEETFERHFYVLGCRRIKGGLNFLNITEVINEIHQTYQICNTKISHIVTDNASNFAKAFRSFSTTNSSNKKCDSYNVGIMSDDSECSDSNYVNGEDSSSSEVECLDSDVEIVELDSIFSKSNNLTKNTNESNIFLPDQMTCCSHTLNLIATVDFSKIIDKTYIKISKSTFSKLSTFWNLLSRSTVASDKVAELCGCKFPVPIVTRWNSMYYSAKKVIDYKEKLTLVFEALQLKKLKNSEWDFLEEYCCVMEPLATATDKLQEEKKSFLGYVTPTILSLKRFQINFSNLVHCKPLSLIIIKSLERRFEYIFDLTNHKSKSFILASMSHPKFKNNWVPARFAETCKQLFINECISLSVSTCLNSDSDYSDFNPESDGSDQEFFNDLLSTILMNKPSESGKMRKRNFISAQALSFLNKKKTDLNVLNTYKYVKQIFLKYNTTLPSSAPVERLFSTGIQILTPRRNRLGDQTFEMLLCCRCLCLKNDKFA